MTSGDVASAMLTVGAPNFYSKPVQHSIPETDPRGQQGPLIMFFCVEPIRTAPLVSHCLGGAASHWSWAFVSPTEKMACTISGDRPREPHERSFALRVEPGIPEARHVVSAILVDQMSLEQVMQDAKELYDEHFNGKKYNALTRNCQDWALQQFATIASKRPLPPFAFPTTCRALALRSVRCVALFSLTYCAAVATANKTKPPKRLQQRPYQRAIPPNVP